MTAQSLPALSSVPRVPLPAGACDAHAHVFGPFDQFELSRDRTRSPPEASPRHHLAMLDRLGFARGVVVQGSAHGTDNRAVAAAVSARPDCLRAIGVIGADVDDDTLGAMVEAGFRGMRFTELVLPGGARKPVSGLDTLRAVGPRLRSYGLHAQLFTEISTFIEAANDLLGLNVPIVVDHMGKAFATPVDLAEPAVQRFLGLVRDGQIWVKMTVIRGSKDFPNYRDMRQLHDALVLANPHQLLWGTDWPLLSLGEKTPDLGRMIDLFDEWTAHDAGLRSSVFVGNPQRLYGF